MISKNGKRIVYADDRKKVHLEALKAEMSKSKGKPISSLTNLTKQEMADAFLAALKMLGMVDDDGVIK